MLSRKLFSVITLITLISFTPFGQTTKEEMLSDLNLTGGVYLAYPVTDKGNAPDISPAPAGYEPFYVSHYGRHGSRYLILNENYEIVRDALHAAARKNALTPLGKDLLQRVDILMKEADKKGGVLSPLGYRQHRGIARRMIDAYPEVFEGDKRISARSSTVSRCVNSMNAFCDEMQQLRPTLKITRDSDKRFMKYIAHHSEESKAWLKDEKNFKEGYNKFEAQLVKPQRLIESIFSDPKFVKRYVDQKNFMWNLYYIAVGMQDVETKLDFYDLFTPDELFNLWQCFNYRIYVRDSNYPGSKGLFLKNAKPLLKNILDSASEAIEGEGYAATLRFGHDANLISLAGLMQLENCYNQESNPEEVYKIFTEWKISPMAGNIQMILFRNSAKPDDVLVKFMLNEKEISIPIPTSEFPFYKWEDVKAFYENILSEN